MNSTTLGIIAIGLAMDAFAVAITGGIILNRSLVKNALRIGVYFGGFQALMPFIGWLIGINLRDFIVEIDHWIAFALLLFIGGKMIYESMKEDEEGKQFDPLDGKMLLLLGIATSIDALAAGISFAFLDISIISSVITIGIITFLLSFIGVLIGKRFGTLIQKKATVLGGVVLISIGIKIVLEHTEVLSAIMSK